MADGELVLRLAPLLLVLLITFEKIESVGVFARGDLAGGDTGPIVKAFGVVGPDFPPETSNIDCHLRADFSLEPPMVPIDFCS
jgi:hypothetical protein